jgi:predicted GIY-YIG superfamily endonuclease
MKKYNSKWTKEKCIQEALKYTNRSDFIKFSSRAYEILRMDGSLDIACKHMKNPHKSAFKWTKEMCHVLALKYQYRKEFQIGDKRAYESAKHNGWLDEICQHMEYKKLPNGYWNDVENCRIRALKYKTKTEFFKCSPHVYKYSLKNGWLDDICQHMIPIGSKYMRCIYAYEFSDNHVYVGLTYNLDKRKYDRNRDNGDAVTIYTKQTNLIPIVKQLTEYLSVGEAIKLENEYLQKYINEGWVTLNRCKTGGIGGSLINLKIK